MKTRTIWLCLTLFAAQLPFAQAQGPQSDPEHRYTIQVPVGWRVTKKPDDMKFSMGDSFIHVLHVPPQGSAVKNLQYGLGMAGENFTGGRDTEHGETTLGGEHAVFYNYDVEDDRSIEMYLHVVATDSGWVYFVATTAAGYSSLRDTLHRIEASLQFTPSTGTTSK